MAAHPSPDRPDLARLRPQAKELRTAGRAGEHGVLARFAVHQDQG